MQTRQFRRASKLRYSPYGALYGTALATGNYLYNRYNNNKQMYRYKRRSYRRPYYKKRRYKSRGYAWRKRKLNMAVKSIELKTHDYNCAAQTMTSAGVIDYLSAIAIGDSTNHREGNEIVPMKLYGNLAMGADPSDTHSTNIRVIIFQDYSNQGVAPTPAEVLESVSPLALKLEKNRDRFRILYDKKWVLSPYQDTGDSIIETMMKTWKSKKAKISYNGTSLNVTDAGEASLWILRLSDEATNPPRLTANLRLRYFG